MSFSMKQTLLNTLRFLNLLEPQNTPVLSLSKIFMWMMIGVTFYVIIWEPDSMLMVIGAVAGLFGGTANYMYRRYSYREGYITPRSGMDDDVFSSDRR